jgi:preprotein translocase subunit SecE
MSRAIRRQQAAAPKESTPPNRRRSLGIGSGPRGPARGARPPAQARRRFRIGVPRFIEEIFSELRKVTWPTAAETRYLTMVVIIVSVIVGVALGAVDVFFSWLIDQLLLS